MRDIKRSELFVLRILVFSGIIAVLFYFAHVIVGRMVWTSYNPFAQPISDLTAVTAISYSIASKILYGYNFFNLLFCGVLLVFFKKYQPINKLFYSGVILKTLAETLSTFGYLFFPLADTTWGNSFQNTMHYIITGVIVASYITLSILIFIGLAKTKKHSKMTGFLLGFSIVFIVSGFLTVVTARTLPAYVGLVERVNLYSLMVLNIVLALWMNGLLTPSNKVQGDREDIPWRI